MSFTDNMKRGWSLWRRSMGVVVRDKTLLVFPLVSVLATAIALGILYISLSQYMINVVLNISMVELIDRGFVLLALSAYFSVIFITVAFNAALVGCTHMSMNERDSKFADGMGIALRSIVSIVLWTLITGTVGVLFSLLDQFRITSGIVRKLLGTTWSVVTFFVLPVVVLEKTNVFSAMRRSPKIMTETWGENLRARFGLAWFAALLNLPILFAIVYLYFSESTLNWLIFELFVFYVALTIILIQAAKSVLTVVLYQYATTQAAPEGWNPVQLQEAFAPEVD